MNYLALIVNVLLGFVIYEIYQFWRKKSELKAIGIPYDGGAWPLLGHFAKGLLRIEHFYDALKRSYNFCPDAKYYAIFEFRSPSLVICDFELIKSIAIKNIDSFVNHRTIVEEKVDPIFGNNLFLLKGQKWKDVRNLLSPAFTSSKMKLMFEVMSECARDFTLSISNMAAPNGKEFEMKDVFTRYGNDVIASCAFGLKIDSLKDPENKFYVLGRKATNFESVLGLKLMLVRIAPWLMHIFGIKVFDDSMTNFFEDVIEKTIKTRDEQKITRPDMLQLMMDARGTPNELTPMEMTAQAFIFFFGGFESTSTSMSFLAHEVAVNAEVQDKLREEIDAAYRETNGHLTYDVVNSLHYLDAVINETLRLYPVNTAMDRQCNSPFDLPPCLPGSKPYTVKPGEVIWFPIGPLLHDPRYFPEPDKFIPERFLDKKTNLNQPPYMPFGIGPRMCLGNRFALMEMKIVMIYLLLRFKLEPCSRTNIPMVFSKSSMVFASKGGWWLSIIPRESSPSDDLVK